MKKQICLFSILFMLLIGCGGQVEEVSTTEPTASAQTPAVPTTTPIPTATVPSEPEAATAVPEESVLNPVWETAVAACTAVGRNQVCQQGQITDMAQVQQVRWGVAEGDEPLLRLAADLDESEGALTLVGLGSGRIVELTTLLVDETAVAIPFAPTDEANKSTASTLADMPEPALQQITFFSETGTAESPSGLLLVAPSAALFTPLGLNGTQLTLLGNAWAEAVPGYSLRLTVLSGDAMMSALGEAVVASVGDQITVPISPDGLATGTPQVNEAELVSIAGALSELAGKVETPPNRTAAQEAELVSIAATLAEQSGRDESELIPIAAVLADQAKEMEESELVSIATALAELKEDDRPRDSNWFRRKQTDFHYRHFLRAYNRCMSDRPDAARYVYNTLYWLRKFETISFLQETIGNAAMARMMDMARRCATFDVDFGSTMTLSGSVITFAAELKAEGVHVQFTPGGGAFLGDVQTLQYRSLTVTGADMPGCVLDIAHPDGTLRIDDGLLAIQENGLRVRLSMLPEVPQESFVYECGGVSSPPTAMFNWFPLFMGLYADIFSEKGFTVTDWHYVGGELMAEAILDRSMSLDGGTLAATTYLVLVHNPKP